MITIIRQYFSYNIANSCTFKVNLDITMKVEKQPFFLLPVKGYLADLRITDSEGNELIILSDSEFEQQMHHKMSDIIDLYTAKLRKDIPKKYLKVIKDYRVVAVLFNRTDDEYYDKIRVSWVEPIENRKRDGFSQLVEIPFYLPRYGFKHGSTSAIYLSFKTTSRYEIVDDPEIRDLLSKKQLKPAVIIDDERHKVYRFSASEEPQMIRVIVRIGLPSTVKSWANLGLISGVLAPAFILGSSIGLGRMVDFGYEILAGTIVFLTGLRVLLFHDISLMKRWNRAYIFLIIYLGGTLGYLVYLFSLLK